MKASHVGPIKEYCVGIFDGPHATPSESDDGAIYLGIKNLSEDGRLDLREIRYVSENDLPKWIRRVKPQPGDLVFTYEATLHRYAIIPEGFRGCLGRRVALVRPDTNKVASLFLLYYFLSARWRQVVESNIITGATVDRIPIERFPNFPVSLPDLPVQKRIADIISAYDQQIDNNLRRITLLEESARLLYEEWFVRLRFPGHEHTRIVNGVPAGWHSGTVGEIVEVFSGFAFKSTTFQSGGTYGVVTIKNVQDGYFDPKCNSFVDDSPKEMPEHCHLQTRDILLSLTGNVGRVCMVYGDSFLLNQRVAKLQPKDGFSGSYVYCTFRNPAFQTHLTNLSYGVAQQNLSPVKMKSVQVVIPPPNILDHFSEVSNPLMKQILTLSKENEKLREARDILLPKLMSEEIKV